VAENAELEEAQQTATRLQALLDLKDTYNLQSTAARIINASYDNWSRTVTLDKGSSSGLAVGMPVTDSYGVHRPDIRSQRHGLPRYASSRMRTRASLP
jgi:rod shape-determining protein MreC